MREGWRRKPGDRVVRLYTRPFRLRRVLGIPALYSVGYGNVGSSIYYALGVVALAAMGATPIALGIAGIFFIFTALTYAEGSTIFPEAGGSATFARYGFNDLVGFISGWALMLSYIVTIAISAFIIPPYLGHFWEPLKEDPLIGTATSMGIIFFLMLLNIFGVKESSFVNILSATCDLLIQLSIVVLGFAFLLNPGLIWQRITLFWPHPQQLLFGIALACLAYTGVETVSQMAEEARQPRLRIPRALILMILTVLVMFSGISLVTFSVMGPDELVSHWAKDPIAGIAHYLPQQLAAKTFGEPLTALLYARFAEILAYILPPLVAILASTILLIATNAGLMGISRLVFSLGKNKQLPLPFSRIHSRFKTPYISILVFTFVAILVLTPGFFSPYFLISLGALYTFGSLLSFALAHGSILSLRIRMPGLHRPFKLGLNIKVANKELPLTALLGLIATSSIWLVIILTQPYSRWVGLTWMGLGLLLYCLYRWHSHLPLTSQVKK
jgi:APA family basic amino acid/polyamine antiporter